MIEAILRGALANRVLVLSAAVGLIGWGAFEASRMPVDVLPDLTAPSVSVVAEAHGMAPEEVERLLTLPLESALNGAPGVRRVRSTTRVGVAVINVDFAWGVGVLEARQIVGERLQLVTPTLPSGTEPPTMGPMTSVMGDILFIGLTSDSVDGMALRTLADWTIAPQIVAVPGVSQVIPIGGDVRQFQVLLDPQRLDAYELTADDVAHALEIGSENTSAGFLTDSGKEYLLYGLGRVETVEHVGETLVAMRGDLPIRVSDVGRTVIGPALARGRGGVNAQSGVVIGIRKQPGTNTLKLTAEVEAALVSIARALPDGVTLHPDLFRQADFIDVAVDNVSAALRDGAILVVLIVLLFLGSARATLITALAIPLSLLAAVVAMRAQGSAINTMTLGGMAIAVGALVDDAIIDVENVARRLSLNAQLPKGERRGVLAVVFHASQEIRRSIVFATLIIVAVFIPLFVLSGIEGRLLEPLGFAYVIALGASLVVALTVTPVLCSLWLPSSRGVTRPRETLVVRALKRAYAPILTASLRRWPLLIIFSLAALTAAGIALASTGRAFLPRFNEGALTISINAPPGTALEVSDVLGRDVEALLLARPEVTSTARRTGRAARDEHAQPVSASEVEAQLAPDVADHEALLDAIRADLAGVPGVAITIGQPLEHRIDHMLSGTRASIAVKIFGPDLNVLAALSKRAEELVKAVPGAVDVSRERQTELPLVTMRLNRGAISRHGLTIEAVSHEIETAFRGRTVGRVLEGRAVTDLVVRYDTTRIDAIEAVEEARIGTPSGARLPLHVFAEVRPALGPAAISRENVERKTVVQANVGGRDLQAVVDDIARTLEQELDRPPGYRVELGGQFERAEATAKLLLWVGLGVTVAIFILLFVALGSARDAALVMANLPLALIGGVAGVYLLDGVVSVASLIGFITLFGIATRNGIMMVTHFQHLVTEEGLTDPWEVVRRGALERVSPILMTALASGLGLLPLWLSAGEPGSEIQAPMAAVIVSGLVTSTALNMLVVPALYLRFGGAVVGLRRAAAAAPDVS